MDEIKEDLTRMEQKLDEHTRILASVDKTLALQAQQLEQHMKRTELAEQNLDLLRKEFKPVQKHVDLINSLAKMFVMSLSLVGATYYAIQIFKFFHG